MGRDRRSVGYPRRRRRNRELRSPSTTLRVAPPITAGASRSSTVIEPSELQTWSRVENLPLDSREERSS